MEKKTEIIKMFREVKNQSGSGTIYFPKELIGKHVEIRFEKVLTEEEVEAIRRQDLRKELTSLRKRRMSRRTYEEKRIEKRCKARLKREQNKYF